MNVCKVLDENCAGDCSQKRCILSHCFRLRVFATTVSIKTKLNHILFPFHEVSHHIQAHIAIFKIKYTTLIYLICEDILELNIDTV